jgi:hypothetical protein
MRAANLRVAAICDSTSLVPDMGSAHADSGGLRWHTVRPADGNAHGVGRVWMGDRRDGDKAGGVLPTRFSGRGPERCGLLA